MRSLLLDSLNEITDRDRRMNLHTHMHMIWHGIYAIESAFLLLTYSENVSIEVSFMLFENRPLTSFSPPDDMVG